MCGIAGILSIGRDIVSRKPLENMADAIAHRGPDDSGTFLSPSRTLGLASRRLAIIDLSPAGHMPMTNEDRSIWLAFNGEIYNFAHLRSRLVSSGHNFISHTDTEVLVHLYEEKGLDFLNDIEGMFSIALWDERRRRLVLARDRYGEKPLYYSTFGGYFRFASEIKAILVDSSVPRHLDLESLNQYLTFGFVQPPNTMFAGIHKLGPGQSLVVEESGACSKHQYWLPLAETAASVDVRQRDTEWHVRKTRTLIENAVASCMRADVPVGAFLSGGVDSSVVVALMSRLTGHQVRALTVSYPEHPECDESGYAQAVSKQVGADLHTFQITDAQAFDAFPSCVYHLDEPIADPACINTYLASKQLRSDGVLVSLVGEGADELFLGYPYYFRHSRLGHVWKIVQSLPPAARAKLTPLAVNLASTLGYSVHSDLVRRMLAGEYMFLSSEPFYPDLDKLGIAGPLLRSLVQANPSAAVTQNVLLKFGRALEGDILAQMSLAETQMRMAEKLLMRVDKLSMAHSIEVRAPFLNKDLARYALSIPGNVRALHGRPKGLLKAAVADLIPAEVLNRPKKGFSTPVGAWFRSSFGQLLEHRLNSDLFRSGVLNAGNVGDLLNQHRNARKSHHTKLWNMLCLTEWYEQFGVTDLVIRDTADAKLGTALVESPAR